MKRTYLAGLLSIALGCAAVSGCGASTTKAALVRPKSTADNAETQLSSENDRESEHNTPKEENGDIQNAEASSDTSAALLQDALHAPEHIQSTVQNDSGRLRILTDADIEIPQVSSVHSIAVSEHPITQEDIDQITEVFFPDAVFYTAESYHQLTRQDYQRKIDLLEQYLAQGNTDPYAYGWTEYDMRQSIENYRQWRDRSPEEKNLMEVPAQLGADANGPGTPEDEMSVVAVTSGGTAYDYTAMNFCGYKVLIEKIRPRSDMDLSRSWTEYQMMKGSGHTVPAEDELEELAGLSPEQAKQIAEDNISQLGLTDMVLSFWDYGLLWEDGTNGYNLSDTPMDVGYALHYARTVNGIPITYTDNAGGASDSMDSDTKTWEYEALDFIITEEGIEQVRIRSPYDVGEPQEETLSLLPFSDIMNIFEKIMLVRNAFVDEYGASREYRIDRITLGYGRIYDPTVSSSSGILIPVWDFFGGFTDTPDEADDQAAERTSYNPAQSQLTINAADGTVIDRSLGY